MPLRHIALAVLVVSIWGFNFTVIKLSVDALPPFLAAGFRFLLTAFPAIFLVKPPRASWALIAGFGTFFGFGLYAFLNVALATGMTASLASVLIQMQAFFTLGLAFLLLGERPRRMQWLGAFIAFAGVVAIATERFQGNMVLPLILTLGGAFSWGVSNIISKKAGKVDPVALTVWGALISCVPLFGISVALEGTEALVDAVTRPDPWTWGVIAFLAYPATLFGLAVWNSLLRRYPASMVAPFSLLAPVAGVVSGWLVLGETISGIEIFGGLLVIVGLSISVLRQRRRAA